jgi:hypothetical protein
MRRAVSPRWYLVIALAAAAMAAAGCGKEIGDSCTLPQDCSPDGDRICDNFQPEGYCTIQGCDFDTCPGEAVCIRFFTGSFTNKACEHATEDITTDVCSIDEVCALEGHCVPRSAEVRFCMKTCGDTTDCRTFYECRDLELMRLHGGEPVLPPDQTIEGLGNDVPGFCAPQPLDP